MLSSTLSSWALLIWNTLKQEGIAPPPVFNAAAADIQKLSDPQARYSDEVMYRLWQAAIEATENEDFGVIVGQNWTATSFHAFGFSWLASNNLLEALNRAVRFASIVSSPVHPHLVKKQNLYYFSITSRKSARPFHPAAMDAAMSVAIKMCRILLGEEFKPLSVSVIRDVRAPGALEAVMGCPIAYNQTDNCFIFDERSVTLELPTGNSALTQVNDHAASAYLDKIDKHDIVGSVQSSITHLLPKGAFSEEEIAQSLHMNSRTLQRKLKEQGTGFREVLNQTRERLAMEYIVNVQMSFTEITYLLGFSDQANFNRAFRRWTGHSPGQYRQTLMQKKLNVLTG